MRFNNQIQVRRTFGKSNNVDNGEGQLMVEEMEEDFGIANVVHDGGSNAILPGEKKSIKERENEEIVNNVIGKEKWKENSYRRTTNKRNQLLN